MKSLETQAPVTPIPADRKIIVAALLLMLVLAGVAWALFTQHARYEKIIPLADIAVDKPYYADWHGQTLLVIRPNDELLATAHDGHIKKGREIVDPPPRTSREAFPYKVFVFDQNQGYLMFGFNKWYNNIVPCAAFHYINQAFVHNNKVINGGFKCSQSLDDFWQDKLVFNLLGRSQSRDVPDLYMPYYQIIGDNLVVGLK